MPGGGQASAVTADAVTHIRSHISHPPPITCHANQRSKAPHDNGHNGSLAPLTKLTMYSKFKLRMHRHASAFLRKSGASGKLGKKTAVHMHSSGI